MNHILLSYHLALLSEAIEDIKELFTPDECEVLAAMLLLTQDNVHVMEE
jgi:hypothetical protein